MFRKQTIIWKVKPILLISNHFKKHYQHCIFLVLKLVIRAGEKAPQVKALATKTTNFNSNPGTHMVKGKN